jgi:molybdopterin converting factor small subunit
MSAIIKIQYFGTLRLLYHMKEETFKLNEPVTFENLINAINEKNGLNFLIKSPHLMFFHYESGEEKSNQLKFPKNKNIYIKSGSIIKIFNAMTLG